MNKTDLVEVGVYLYDPQVGIVRTMWVNPPTEVKLWDIRGSAAYFKDAKEVLALPLVPQEQAAKLEELFSDAYNLESELYYGKHSSWIERYNEQYA